MTVLYHAGDGWDPAIGYWKYGPETPGQALTSKWYQLPGAVFDTTTVAGNTVARANFTLNDGQLGDDTGVDGEIVDQGGPGAPGPMSSIPTTSEWMLLLLMMTLAITGFWKLR
ncbi:MAG: IPTL-CTERM sorting domain-containing protein [Acidobacteria bacterium]|nr:IPTL-CTERM sorting domain-containing protein [Acidobacteriota bacterium]